MTQIQLSKILASLFTIFLITSCAGCAGKPVTLVNIDMKHNAGHVEKIVDVDQKKCKLISETQPPVPLQYNTGKINPMFDKGFWISEQDYFTMYKAWLKDCKDKTK